MTIKQDADRLRRVAAAVPVGAALDLTVQLESVGVAVAELLGGGDEVIQRIRAVLDQIATLAGALARVRILIERAAEYHDPGGTPASPAVTAVSEPGSGTQPVTNERSKLCGPSCRRPCGRVPGRKRTAGGLARTAPHTWS